MNVIIKLPKVVKNAIGARAENSLKTIYRNLKFDITFYKPDPQLKFIEDESQFVISQCISMDDEYCYISLGDKIDSKLKNFIIKNSKDMVVVLDLEYSYKNNKCFIENIKSADVILKSDMDVIAKEWTDIDPLKIVIAKCPNCNRPFEISLNRPEYTCACGAEYKMEKSFNTYYKSGYMIRRMEKKS